MKKKEKGKEMYFEPRSENLVCDIEKGTRCSDSFPSYKDGICYHCGGQAK